MIQWKKVSVTTIACCPSPSTCRRAHSLPKLGFMSSCCGGIVTVQVIWREWQQQAFPDWSPELSHLRMRLAPSPVLENSPWHPPGWSLPQICPFKWQRRGVRDQKTLTLSFIFSHQETRKWLNMSPTPRWVKSKTKKITPFRLTLENYMTNPWTDVEFYTQSKWLQVPARLLAWNSWLMRGSRFGWAWVHPERKEQRGKIYKQMLNFMCKNDEELLLNIFSQKYFFDWSKWAWPKWIKLQDNYSEANSNSF